MRRTEYMNAIANIDSVWESNKSIMSKQDADNIACKSVTELAILIDDGKDVSVYVKDIENDWFDHRGKRW